MSVNVRKALICLRCGERKILKRQDGINILQCARVGDGKKFILLYIHCPKIAPPPKKKVSRITPRIKLGLKGLFTVSQFMQDL